MSLSALVILMLLVMSPSFQLKKKNSTVAAKEVLTDGLSGNPSELGTF
jgi:hypothetical protein